MISAGILVPTSAILSSVRFSSPERLLLATSSGPKALPCTASVSCPLLHLVVVSPVQANEAKGGCKARGASIPKVRFGFGLAAKINTRWACSMTYIHICQYGPACLGLCVGQSAAGVQRWCRGCDCACAAQRHRRSIRLRKGWSNIGNAFQMEPGANVALRMWCLWAMPCMLCRVAASDPWVIFVNMQRRERMRTSS